MIISHFSKLKNPDISFTKVVFQLQDIQTKAIFFPPSKEAEKSSNTLFSQYEKVKFLISTFQDLYSKSFQVFSHFISGQSSIKFQNLSTNQKLFVKSLKNLTNSNIFCFRSDIIIKIDIKTSYQIL
jgi:hypothetical protein